MKNKLLKTIASITCGLGIILSIPFAATSCGCSVKKDKPLPEEVYKITDKYSRTTLEGFTDEFIENQNDYKDYNTMQIPININNIIVDAFNGKIPPFITKIIFPPEMKDEIYTDYGIFAGNHSITSVVLPGNLKSTTQGIFNDCSNLTSITWDAWNCAYFDFNGFLGVAAKGIVKVTNPIDDEHDSAALLTVLKQKGG